MFHACFIILLVISTALSNPLFGEEVIAFKSLLDDLVNQEKYIHMVEYGGDIVSEFSEHKAIVSWSVITHEKDISNSLAAEFSGSRRVIVKHVRSDNDIKYDQSQEGTFSGFEKYISEIRFFGAKDKSAYWLTNSGKARVDVGIAALPLLSRTGGVMLVPDWEGCQCCEVSLLLFYELQSLVGSLAVLKPKDVHSLEALGNDGYRYNWCFSFASQKSIVLDMGPSDTSGVVTTFQELVKDCADMQADFHCEEGLNSNTCVSCMSVLSAISKRGFWVKQSLQRAIEGLREEL